MNIESIITVVKDRAIDTFDMMANMTTAAQSVRSFTDALNMDPARSPMAAHPDDYDLYAIGKYNNNTGVITPITPPELIVRGKDLIRPKGE